MSEPAATTQSTEINNGESLTLVSDEIDREIYAMHGFSFGLIGATQDYNQVIERYNPSTGADIASARIPETKGFQNFGVMGRYSILPVDRIGTDINVSYVKSMNHTSIGREGMSAIKGELNLAYTFGISRAVKLYVLAGGGVEQLSGTQILSLADAQGYGGQAGFGINFGTINLEAMYSFYRHKISNGLIGAGTSTDTVRAEKSFVDFSGIAGRASFNF